MTPAQAKFLRSVRDDMPEKLIQWRYEDDNGDVCGLGHLGRNIGLDFPYGGMELGGFVKLAMAYGLTTDDMHRIVNANENAHELGRKEAVVDAINSILVDYGYETEYWK